MNKRISLGVIAGLILVGVFFYFTVFKGISELSAKPAEPDRAKRGDVIEYRVIYAKEVFEIKHMLFGVIPTYSEHFYVTLNEDGINQLVIRADEQWFSENFTADGLAKVPVIVSGLIKSAGSKKGLNLNSVSSQLGDIGHIATGQYVDASYVSEATLKIVSGILLLTTVITVVLMLILLSNGVIKKVGTGVNIMIIAAIIQALAFAIIMFAI